MNCILPVPCIRHAPRHWLFPSISHTPEAFGTGYSSEAPPEAFTFYYGQGPMAEF